MARTVAIGAVAILCATGTRAQEKTSGFSVIVKGNLTTSAQVFLNPNAIDPIARADAFGLTSIYGYGIEVRYRFPESNVAVGVSSDFIHTMSPHTLPVLSPVDQSVTAMDGYSVLPVELTGYFFIPVSGPTFGLFMGGGGGVYFGHRIYRIENVEAASVRNVEGYGIHVVAGARYEFTRRFWLMGEMKFRDAEFQSTDAFSVPSIVLPGGGVYSVSKTPFDSRIHTDGIVFQLGVAYDL